MAETTGIASNKRRYGRPLSQNPNWKGGRTIASNGYVLVKRPDHPDADVRGYVYEHRLVAEQKIGRRLRSGEEAHHVNQSGDKTDNRPENIEVKRSHAHHAVEHRTAKSMHRLRMPGARNPMILCACGCRAKLRKFDGDGRPRKFLSGHNTAERNRRRG